MEKITTEAVKLLCDLIKIPSYSRDEKDVADFFQKYIEDKGFKTNRLNNNIWIINEHFDAGLPTLLLNAHIDTVKPVQGWTTDPHCPIEKDGAIYGLGANDDGASLVSLFYTFAETQQNISNFNLIYLASAEEEVSGKNGIESVLPLLPKIDAAIVGEPTGMNPAVAEKGLMVLDCTAHGVAGHAARNTGENAIYKAIQDIEWIKNNIPDKQTELLGPVKMTTTMIKSGTQHNVIPDICEFVVDVRSNECYSNEELYDIVSKGIQSEVKARSFRLNSSHIDIEHPLVKKIISLGRKPFGSPTLSDQALMRFPSVKIGPGESVRSHTANEYIMMKEIDEAIDMYSYILKGLEL